MNQFSSCNVTPMIGEVYMMQFEGSMCKQNGWRPGVVLQNNVGNIYSPNVIDLPLTSVIKKISQPTHVVLFAADTGLRTDGMVLCENPETVPKERVGKFVTKLSDEYMRKIARASLVATAAIAYLSLDELDVVLQTSIKLNQVDTFYV